MKEKSVDNKRIIDYYTCIYQNIMEEYQLDFVFLKHQIEYLTTMLKYKLEEEPLKIRRKKHLEWRKEVNCLEEKLTSCYLEFDDLFVHLKSLNVNKDVKQ